MNDSETPGKSLEPSDLLRLTSLVSSAYFANNATPTDQVPDIILNIRNALAATIDDSTPEERPEPAVPVRKSIMPDYLVCLEDGKKLKMLKRYLKARYDMTPDDYRERWDLPPDYPMVAPNYARQRAEFARKIGLGKKN
ncbi:MAG: MucR family transcriptional regulator [Minwuia sp.]|uniref:MucR family transcriptional regulator n=1 Tax=Minwuia sp. TaxID=2493630 RepID=UPI003A83803E